MPDEWLRWTGAGTLPARGFGYLRATMPLVVVELAGPRLTVRLRPAVLAGLSGTRSLTAMPASRHPEHSLVPLLVWSQSMRVAGTLPA
jgi:hypothetical protein